MPDKQWNGRTERRRDPRYVADINGRLLWDGMNQPVNIVDISRYGALLDSRYPPPVGTRVTLIADGLERTGTVIWLGVDQCGILLSRAVEPLRVIRERPVRTKSITVRAML
ncbi:hypothetical protein GGR44_003224 [Sphingobium fontiphilum]|uniref:PilZ domain-containing protein n=1 Tax=Sphingobium fontiphilum TaxID=944425 RepID=A0A7W6DPA2_9SPHN|nr:PilZ domain-containing protein [Sphingobium fontiphilum]MBB3983533.1 hypothetical protein [Sphingobium fontiphilum]